MVLQAVLHWTPLARVPPLSVPTIESINSRQRGTRSELRSTRGDDRAQYYIRTDISCGQIERYSEAVQHRV